MPAHAAGLCKITSVRIHSRIICANCLMEERVTMRKFLTMVIALLLTAYSHP